MAKPRIPIRTIPCSECTTPFGQTASEVSRGVSLCPSCQSSKRLETKQGKSTLKPRNYLEIVLPTVRKPYLDKKRGEWCMRVRVRKRGTNEPFKTDKVWLGVKAEDDPQQAFLTAYARMQMNGSASKLTKEKKQKKQKKIDQIKHDLRSWRQGVDRDLGVYREVVRRVVFKVYLPDPLIDGKRIYVGRYDTRLEAREARNAKYKEIQFTHVPCAVCGKMPELNKTNQLYHNDPDCPNKIRIPRPVRPLLASKLWNLIFSKGETTVESIDDLIDRGFFYRTKFGWQTRPIRYVEYDFSLAPKYAEARKARSHAEEEAVFE